MSNFLFLKTSFLGIKCLDINFGGRVDMIRSGTSSLSQTAIKSVIVDGE